MLQNAIVCYSILDYATIFYSLIQYAPVCYSMRITIIEVIIIIKVVKTKPHDFFPPRPVHREHEDAVGLPSSQRPLPAADTRHVQYI